MNKGSKSFGLLMLIHINNRVLTGKPISKVSVNTLFDRNTLAEYVVGYFTSEINPNYICCSYCSSCIHRNHKSSVYGFTCSMLVYINRNLLSIICSKRN